MSSIFLDSMPPTPRNGLSAQQDHPEDMPALPRPRFPTGHPAASNDSIQSLESPTPNQQGNHGFNFSSSSSGYNTPARSPNPFGVLSSLHNSTTNMTISTPFFQSRRKRKEEIAKPWMDNKKDKRIGTIWHWLFPLIGTIIGIGGAGVQIFFSSQKYAAFAMCPVLDEDFSSGVLNPDIWTHEVEVGGFGNGEFEMTTTDPSNSFIQDGSLIIKPTLQDPSLITTNNILNLQNSGCTGSNYYSCVVATNVTNGTIVNPVRSARLNTKKGASIKYGRVEVTAKLPVGDWLWPAIWMLPTQSVYGQWPASGEIDIMESRGNNLTYPNGGNNVVHQTTHWGPDGTMDQAFWTTAGSRALHATYGDGFHTYGLQWTEKYLFTYIDARVRQILYQDFDKKSLWSQGHFPGAYGNGSQVLDPWANATKAAPFDQDFYLILNLAVGGTNGWFQDGQAGKPWSDGSTDAKLQFWNAQKEWLPTWEKQGQLEIKSVKMWQKKGYNGC